MENSHSKKAKQRPSRSGRLSKFLNSEKDIPILAAVGAGLYPIFFYFSNNYTLINTWGHIGFFVLFFLLLPIIGFVIANKIFKKSIFAKWQKYVLPFLNIFVFLFLLKVCLYAGLQKKLILVILLVSTLFAFFMYKHLKKAIIIQLILAVIGIFTLIPAVISQLNYSSEWMKQPDDIVSAEFIKKPNVYFIQPDGYVNFSELENNKYYKVDNGDFKDFLVENNFKNYPDFRSNYASTLASNSATFMMKHHYYNKGSSFSEAVNARNVIISDNAVLNTFKRNGYKTHFLAELPYLLLNRPEMGYDYSNFSTSDVAYIGTGLGDRKDIIEPLKESIGIELERPKFFFIEIFNPGHIHGRKIDSKGVEGERQLWKESLQNANKILKKTIAHILDMDPNALIIIMADHGGFVGMKYTSQTYEKVQDRDIIYSIFSSQLSIHWPEGKIPEYDSNFVSSINVFRILFAYLSGEQSYLDNLQPDESYVLIREGAPKGTYKYIDDDGNIVFEKH